MQSTLIGPSRQRQKSLQLDDSSRWRSECVQIYVLNIYMAWIKLQHRLSLKRLSIFSVKKKCHLILITYSQNHVVVGFILSVNILTFIMN